MSLLFGLVISVAHLQSGVKENIEPACLLQSTVSSSDLQIEEAHSPRVREARQAVLFEAESTESETMESLRQRSMARTKRNKAYLSLLSRSMAGLEESRNTSIKELVDKFISQQSGSQDACASQLMEAKHQLNQIHKYVNDLSVTVNATERAIVALDKEQQGKLKELKELEQWKQEELAACQKQRDEAAEMYGKLSDEMKEMKQIASPGVVMDVASKTIVTAEEASLLEGRTRQVAFIDQKKPHPKEATTEKKFEMLQSFIEKTKSAAQEYASCVKKFPAGGIRANMGPLHQFGSSNEQEHEDTGANEKGSSRHVSSLSSSSSTNKHKQDPMAEGESEVADTPSEADCAAEKAKLEKVYVKTYVELTRLKAEYSDMANSTACDDSVLAEFGAKKAPLQADMDYLIKAIDKKVKALQELRPRLETALEAEKKLRKQIATLTEECAALPETESDLDKVREAIQALAACPGLSRVQFSIPKWTGTFASFDQDAASQSDEQQDKLMDAACDKETAGSRAAEVGEIEELTIEGIPTTNDADMQVIGACPNCAGESGTSFVSEHARICWDPGKEFGHAEKNTGCSKGLKATICVIDRPNIRQIPTES